MLKNFKNGYAVSGSNATAKIEKNDCVVRAIANACDVNYNQAHKYVKDTFNRKKGKGVKWFADTLGTITNNDTDSAEMSFDPIGQLNLFTDGIKRTLKFIGESPKRGGKLTNPKYKHKPVAYTIKSFAQAFNKGNYIVAVEGHALAVNDGVVIDNSNYQYGGYRRVVEGAYQVQ